MWWLDPFQGYVGNSVSFAEFSHALKKKKKRIKKIQKKIIPKKKRKQKKTRIIRKEIIKKKIIKKKKKEEKLSKKKICWTTWWLDSSPGYVRSLVLVTEFSHMKRRRIASLQWTRHCLRTVNFSMWWSRVVVVENEDCKELTLKWWWT